MTVGQASGINQTISPDAVVRVGPSSPRVPVTRVPRDGGLQERSQAQPVAAGPAGRDAAGPLSIAGRKPGMRVGMFFSSDGDSAELTGRAMNLSPRKLSLPPTYGGTLESAAPESARPTSPPQEAVLPYVTEVVSPFVPLPAAEPAPEGPRAGENTAAPLDALTPPGECKTCASRKYVDDSSDPSVSFQTPTSVSANMSTAAVASHENEHVGNERAKAYRDDREIINQTVTLKYAVCPECGKTYASGGNTRTVTRAKPESDREETETTGPGLPDTNS